VDDAQKVLHTYHTDFCSVMYSTYIQQWLKFCVCYITTAFVCRYKHLMLCSTHYRSCPYAVGCVVCVGGNCLLMQWLES